MFESSRERLLIEFRRRKWVENYDAAVTLSNKGFIERKCLNTQAEEVIKSDMKTQKQTQRETQLKPVRFSYLSRELINMRLLQPNEPTQRTGSFTASAMRKISRSVRQLLQC